MTAPVDVARLDVGGHGLPQLFSSAPRGETSTRRPRAPLVLGTVAVLVVAATLGTLQLTANLGYDDARAAFDAALAETSSAGGAVRQELDALESTVSSADLLVQIDTGVLAAPAAREALSAAASASDDAAAPAAVLLDGSLPTAGTKPGMFWELYGASGSLSENTRGLEDLTAALGDAIPSVTAAGASVTDAGVALLASAADAAPGFEAAHLSAKNDAVIALRDAAAAASTTTLLDDSTVSALTALQDAAGQVVATEQIELAEKAGPLQGARLEIEAFARSLAPGVLLEFDWYPVVNNAGYNGSMGGLTRWWWDDPDRAVIELSNSVAEQWPAERSQALIAHEVGHAISVKCEDMYDSSTQDSIEKWATAWAISMGFTDDANGVWAYGYPPQSYIDAAYGCR